MNEFDDAYGATAEYFGGQPEHTLVDHIALVDADLPVLDIGCGQGRNTFFLARRGLTVDALDPSAVAIDQVTREAAKASLPIRTIQGTFQEVQAADGRYGAVLVYGLIPLLDRQEIDVLINVTGRCLAAGGLLFVTAFGTWDSVFPRIASEWDQLSTNSFRGADGEIRTYLEPGELRHLYSEFDAIHSWEGLGPEHRHGSGPGERHGMAEAVLRR